LNIPEVDDMHIFESIAVLHSNVVVLHPFFFNFLEHTEIQMSFEQLVIVHGLFTSCTKPG
jgi:hypothetical protein